MRWRGVEVIEVEASRAITWSVIVVLGNTLLTRNGKI